MYQLLRQLSFGYHVHTKTSLSTATISALAKSIEIGMKRYQRREPSPPPPFAVGTGVAQIVQSLCEYIIMSVVPTQSSNWTGLYSDMSQTAVISTLLLFSASRQGFEQLSESRCQFWPFRWREDEENWPDHELPGKNWSVGKERVVFFALHLPTAPPVFSFAL